jgi:membrane fusion protein (multidrug efflux system)
MCFLTVEELICMAEEQPRTRRRLTTPILLMRRALGRPYLFMAAVLLIIGAIWFIRLALEEFLLLDRLINVYTNEAQVKMDTFAIKPGVTADVLEVLVQEGDAVQKGQVLVRLAQDDILIELRKAEAVAEGIAQQVQEMRLEIPLAIERARGEVSRAQALLETKEQAYQRAQELLFVERDRVDKTLREQDASLEAARARLREQETSWREADMALQRTRTLFADGIVPQDRLETAQLTLERARARLQAAEEQVRQVQEQYPSRDSPLMTRVHEKDLQRHGAEIKEQRAALALARTNLRLVEAGEQRLKVLEAKYKEALTQVETSQLRLAKTIVQSPVDGIVGYRKVEPGETVKGDAGNPPIMLIHDPRSSVIEAQVWESDIRRVAIGRPVEIWIDAFKTSTLGRGTPFRGRVARINPTTYSEVAGLPPERFFTRRERKVPVKIALQDPDPGLRAGMLAEVLILVDDGAVAQEQRRR